MSVKRYGFPMCECDATDEFHMQEMGMTELNDGGFVLWDDYASLKSEVERLKGIILAQSSDFVRSKTADDGIKPEGHNDLAGRAVERCLELQAENERLAGEVNRLYLKTELLVECGDEMANRAGQEWCPTWVVEDWNKAKEGKQS